MNEQDARTDQGQANRENQRGQEQAGPAGMPSCCGPTMAEMMKECPCGSFLKQHWGAALAIFAVMVLMFLVSQVGGILGIIAFFRTL